MIDLPGRILYIDDDKNLQEMVGESLGARGNTNIMACSSCDEAVFRGPGFAPHLILLDMCMPDKDGPATLRALRQTKGLETVPVVFVTGARKLVMDEKYRQLGAIGVIHKPFTGSGLKKQVSALWSSSHMAAK